MHVSLDRAFPNTINISTPDFDSKWTTAHMQKLTDMPKVPIAQLYKHVIG